MKNVKLWHIALVALAISLLGGRPVAAQGLDDCWLQSCTDGSPDNFEICLDPPGSPETITCQVIASDPAPPPTCSESKDWNTFFASASYCLEFTTTSCDVSSSGFTAGAGCTGDNNILDCGGCP